MIKVNKYMLEHILSPLGGTADDDREIIRFQNFDNNNETFVKRVIESDIQPFFDKQPEAYKKSLMNSLSYFLTTNSIDYGEIYDNCLIAFDHPANPRDFFLWIWQTLFGSDNYIINDVSPYTRMDNIGEANSYLPT